MNHPTAGSPSKLTSKGQVTIPKEIRARLKLKEGDYIEWVEVRPGVMEVRRVEPAQTYVSALEGTLAQEWLSEEDDEAYRDL